MSGSLRLNGSTSGFSEITAPDVAGDQTFTLPAVGGELMTVDTIFESNDTGTSGYIKFANGNLICYNRAVASTSAAGTSIFGNTWVFPEPFIIDPCVIVSVESGDNDNDYFCLAMSRLVTPTSVRVYGQKQNPNGTMRLSCQAIGRWK